MNNYDDIIKLPHHTSKTRKSMSLYNRAAQFAPFAALTGYGTAINETARRTNKKIELDDDSKYMISEKLKLIIKDIKNHPKIRVLYYVPDQKKEGGSYQTIESNLKKIDDVYKIIYLSEIKINIEDIIDIEILK